MVSILVVSEYSGPSACTGVSAKIAGGPLYELARVRGLCQQGNGIVLWTRRCINKVADLGWTTRDVAELIDDLASHGTYIDSEWCDNGRNAWAAADAYKVARKEWIAYAHKDMLIEYFIKFAIGKQGNVVLTVSCHAPT